MRAIYVQLTSGLVLIILIEWIREEIVYLVQIEAAWKDRAQLNSFPKQKIDCEEQQRGELTRSR